jgi:K(+)-stimulated pyrophosphate-energized sodium pump
VSSYIWVPISIGLLAILFAAYLAFSVLRKDTGTPAMQKVSNAIFQGAKAFLNRQYRTIAILALVAAVGVGGILALLSQGSDAVRISLAWHTSLAFIIGALCSGVAGYVGMYIAVKANIRTASAATRSLGEALMVALRGGPSPVFWWSHSRCWASPFSSQPIVSALLLKMCHR